MNRILLYLMMLPEGLWTRLGADPIQLRAILDIKLKLDDRRPISMGRQRQQKKARRFSIILGMFISFLTGLAYVYPLAFMTDRLTALCTLFTLFLFLLSFTLISDFSTVLIDTRDKYIVLPRPVSDRTLFLSRMLHIFVYIFRIVLPMSLPAWVTLGILDGWKAAVFYPFPVLLLVFTSLFLVMGVYLFILRVATAQKIKELLSYFQIAFSVMVIAIYYLMPRALDKASMRDFNIDNFHWARFTPPYWLAATFSWINPGVNHGSGTAYLGLLAIALPVLCFIITIKYLAPQFASRISGLDAIESGEMPAGAKLKAQKSNRFYLRLARLLNNRPDAQAGFILAWVQTSRSRTFKMKVYPMFAYVPIACLSLMIRSKKPIREVWEDLPYGGGHIFLLYMCAMVMLGAFSFVNISEQYKAAWVYRAVPLAEPGAIMGGTFKVIWVKYFLPFFAVISAFVLAVWGLPAISDVVLALVNVTLFAACLVRVAYRRLPFSELEQTPTGGSRFLRVMIGMLVPAALGIGHFLALHMLWLKGIYIGLSATMLWLVWDSYAHTSWEVIKTETA